jgi:hypothetical protein
MSSKHSFFVAVAVACALPLSFAACGSSGGESPIIPEGAHYGYVVSSASVPTMDKEVTSFGLDLGSMNSSKRDNVPDNKLGRLLFTLSAFVDIQGAINTAISTGSIILLVDVQTKDLANSSAAGFGVKIGAKPTPPACTDMNDTTCRHHLDGHGSFQIADGSPTDAVVAGKIVGGAFTGGPGDVTLQLSLGSGMPPITLTLLRARVEATISATGIMDAKVGGLLTQTEIMTAIIPVVQVQANNLLTQSCTRSGQTCTCTGTGASFLIGLDTNHDCQLSTEEILAFGPVQTALSPDICTTDSCTTPDGLSIGVPVQAVKATFPGAI